MNGTLKANGAGGFPRTDRQPLLVGAITSSVAQLDDQDTTRLVADTLTSGSHPASNMPGRRREDDTNLVGTLGRSYADRGVDVEATHIPSAQGVRRLTPVETERLQGFPDDWTAIDGERTPDSRRYAAMGDAVTVPVIRWLGERLARAVH